MKRAKHILPALLLLAAIIISCRCLCRILIPR